MFQTSSEAPSRRRRRNGRLYLRWRSLFSYQFYYFSFFFLSFSNWRRSNRHNVISRTENLGFRYQRSDIRVTRRVPDFEYWFSGLSVPAYLFRFSTFPGRFPPESSYPLLPVARFEGVFVRFSLARHPRGELKQCGFSPGTFRFDPSAFASFVSSSRRLVFLPTTLFVGKKQIKRITADARFEFFVSEWNRNRSG